MCNLCVQQGQILKAILGLPARQGGALGLFWFLKQSENLKAAKTQMLFS